MIRAIQVLCEMGVDENDARAVFGFLRQHAHDAFPGGMHTNGGCHDGRCDYGCQLCASFTAMCAAVERFGK